MAREIEVALAIDFDTETQKKLIREFVKVNLTAHGAAVDFAIHEGGGKAKNPHAHILFATRAIEVDGSLSKKILAFDKTESLEGWRSSWAEIVNRELTLQGIDKRTHHISLHSQGIEIEATKHVGAVATAMAAWGTHEPRRP